MSRGRLYTDSGIVLRTIKLGEADRIVAMMTEHHGKVRAVVKGARKTRSKMGAALEPLRHVRAQLHEGRNLDVVTQAESIDHFREVRDDLVRLTRAMALVEAVDQVAQEGEENPRLYRMLLGALRTLAAQPAPTVVGAFYWKLLAAEGFQPVLEMCAGCGSPDGLTALDLAHGGLVCRQCRGAALPVSADGVALMRRMLGGDLVAVLGEPASVAVTEVEGLATKAMEHHLERRLRAVRALGG